MKTTIRYYRMERRQISFVKFILEAYDNLAVLTTIEPHQALVQVAIAPGCEHLVGGIMNNFAGEFSVVSVDKPA